jgi:NAD(P)-dependent dehydrogenase (short-subunit alcohol dehydrogenase family)
MSATLPSAGRETPPVSHLSPKFREATKSGSICSTVCQDSPQEPWAATNASLISCSRSEPVDVNVSSIWGLADVPSSYAYQAAKGAILNVSKNVAAAHGEDGIRCNSLHPGYILSPMNEHQAPEINAALIAGTVLKRPGVPIETAYAALFLASDEASYVTGTALVVDGGHLAQSVLRIGTPHLWWRRPAACIRRDDDPGILRFSLRCRSG